MSRRIDDLSVQMRAMDTKLDNHRTHLEKKMDLNRDHTDTKLEEIISTLAVVKESKAVEEASLKTEKDERERSLKSRTFALEFVSAFALIGSVFASALAAHVI